MPEAESIAHTRGLVVRSSTLRQAAWSWVNSWPGTVACATASSSVARLRASVTAATRAGSTGMRSRVR